MKKVHIILGAPKQEAIKPLMDEKGIVIGVDRGALLAIQEKIQVDIAIGDFDSISKEEKNIIQLNVGKLMNFPADKDDTDAELAVLYAVEHYPGSEIYIYNWYGGRIDHMYSILLLAVQKRFETAIQNLYYVSEKNHISFYLPGEHELTKMRKMDYLSFVLLTAVEHLSLYDVKYTLEDKSFEQPLALISNEFIDNKASFSFKNGIIAAVQSRD